MLLVQFIIIQIIIFAVVIFFLKKIMLGSTESAVTRLNESYKDMNAKKEELAQKIKEAQEDYEARKKEAEKVAEKVKNDADTEMREQRDALLKKTREEAERMIADTMGAKEKIREEILKEEQMKIIDRCGNLVGNVYKDAVRQKMDELLITDFLDELKEMDVSSMPDGIELIETITRSPLTDGIKNNINSIVKEKMKRDIALKETVDENVIGGIVMRFGNLELDGSIAGKLKEVASATKEKIEKGH